MTVLIIGASGATGRLIVEQLLSRGISVIIIVRPTSILPDTWGENSKLTIIRKTLTELTVDELTGYLKDCQAVASCLGHNLSMKGVFGEPRKLVTNAVRLLCEAIQHLSPQEPVRFALMNTAGNGNRDLNEPVSRGQKFVIWLLRILLPPHPDNEQAADYLRTQIGQKNPCIEWVAVRPDNLIDEENVSDYTLHASPLRSAIFNPGETSRVNVAHFMSRLLIDSEIWNQWKGQMPVIYNADSN